jgi:hypothetical protein
MVGATSDDLRLQQEVTLAGAKQEVREPVFGSEVQVVSG